jgi:teichuronic acid biosynthesis glycosyltransferase TuaG
MIAVDADQWDDRLVSIITPAYKAESYVGQTIQSVLDQTYPHWEMLIAEDCSPDNSRDVISSWAAKDPRIKLLALEKNGGPAAARNAAIAAARGRWLAYLDSDDLWLPQKLERQLAFAQQHQAPLSFTGFRRIDASGGATGHYISVPPSLTYRQLLANTAIATSTVLVDRRQTGTVWMKKVFYDDFAAWLEMLRPGRTALGLDEDLMRYRVLSGSVSRNKRRSAHEIFKSYMDVEKLSRAEALWYFSGYAIRGFLKYRRF